MSRPRPTTVRGGVASRVKALAPALERVLNGEARDAGHVWRFGASEIRLGDWESVRVARATRLRSVVESDDGCHLVAQGVALFDKCAGDVAALLDAVGSTDEFYRCQAELMLDAAIGAALIADTQRAIDRHVAAGRLHEARHFTGFRHNLRRVVVEARRGISESERSWADGVAPRLSEVVASTPRSNSAPARGAGRRAGHRPAPPGGPRGADPRTRPPGGSSGGPAPLTILVATALALAATWFVIAAPRVFAGGGPRAVAASLAATVPHGGAIAGVVSRPPSLFVDVDPAAWEALSSDARSAFARGIAAAASGSFGGALVRTTDGRALVGWYAGQGLRWIESGEGPATLSGHADAGVKQ